MKTRIAILIALLTLCIAFNVSSKETIKGNGTIVTRSIPIDDFDQLRLGHGIGYNYKTSGINVFKSKKVNFPKFYYTQSDKENELIITMDENLFSWIEIEQEDGKLRIQSQKEDIDIVATQITIKAKSGGLKSVDIYGAIDFISESLYQVENLRLSISGIGEIIFDNLICENIDCDVSGIGSIYLTGSAKQGNYNVSGVGKVFAFDYVVDNLSCEVSGVGKIEANVKNKLTAETSGVGKIRYKGNPTTLNKENSGIGSIKQK